MKAWVRGYILRPFNSKRALLTRLSKKSGMLTLMTGLNSVFLRAGSSHQKQRQKSDCQDFCFLLKKEVLKN